PLGGFLSGGGAPRKPGGPESGAPNRSQKCASSHAMMIAAARVFVYVHQCILPLRTFRAIADDRV
ncbi:MAG: hypothetical protein NTU94_08980, partial [Planctomycetota bacterium]|nr:hypothetical protein [Planctomycetota bacterium]